MCEEMSGFQRSAAKYLSPDNVRGHNNIVIFWVELGKFSTSEAVLKAFAGGNKSSVLKSVTSLCSEEIEWLGLLKVLSTD